MSDLLERDRKFAWHPYTQHGTEKDPVAIVRARGASLFDADNREILDLISSWWTCVHGHAHLAINQALCDQANQLEHVMFAGFTHPPAVDLAEQLGRHLGHGLQRVFYSDNGSTANEVALKMAYQYWRNKGQPNRQLFLSFEGDYHGDTLGAMSVSKGSGFFTLFEELMCEAGTIPFAWTYEGDLDIENREAQALDVFKNLLEQQGEQVAALIVEPLLQGAAGIRICRPAFLDQVVKLARAYDILVIFDEVATGFGRTGKMFAFEHCDIIPDIICLSKGLTGGYMPLSATVVREELFAVFTGRNFDRALAHGHSYTANPLACAVALKSLELFTTQNTFEQIAMINRYYHARLPRLQAHAQIEKVRILGSILAFDLKDGVAGYKSQASIFLRDWYLQQGLNIRPYGKTIYLMPPYCITEEQLKQGFEGMLEGLKELARRI